VDIQGHHSAFFTQEIVQQIESDYETVIFRHCRGLCKNLSFFSSQCLFTSNARSIQNGKSCHMGCQVNKAKCNWYGRMRYTRETITERLNTVYTSFNQDSELLNVSIESMRMMTENDVWRDLLI